MAVGARSCLVSSCRISHFGMKPVSGGRPPRDRRTRGKRDVRMGVLAQDVASALIVVVLLRMNVRKAEEVMIRYNISVRRVRVGENCRIKIIQPRWAMDEYARIFRSWVWFRPPQPPISVDNTPRMTSSVGLFG